MKILISVPAAFTSEHLMHLTNMGHLLTILQGETIPEEMKVEDFEVVVCNNLLRDYPIEQFKNLKLIQLTSVGTDRIPLKYILKQGIKIETARGVYSIPIAEWVVLKILEIYKNSRFFHHVQQLHKWEKKRNLGELAGKTVAIIGYGSIGIETAKRLKAFDVRITAIDSRIPDPEEMKWVDNLQPPHQLETVISQCDVLILTIPLTEQTKHLMNEDRLLMMKSNSILINVSRGAIIDEQALITVLQQKKFMGVALDVFEEEPLSANNPLWDLENTLVTPHNAFVSDKNQQRLFDLFIANLNSNTIKYEEISANIA
ncbi:MAG TPA: NAD(P)-dependent oxidoreductase [Mariniphaga sp.]|nr:NAD(P)-dependent oxidoreductase [Mariniphaga sp.]